VVKKATWDKPGAKLKDSLTHIWAGKPGASDMGMKKIMGRRGRAHQITFETPTFMNPREGH